LTTAGAAAGATAFPLAPARAAAKYRRYNVTSPEGQKMLASYAKGVEAMLKLPADNPQNWFRNAFIHLMDCPHGNWWFYVWHRGYLGYLERTIRALSGDDNFALPYWDWTQLPQIPDGMFDGVLTPTDKGFEPYTGNLALFTSFIQPALTNYWNGLSPAQRGQLNTRGYKAFTDLWNDVTGFNPAPAIQAGISGNEAFAITCGARYLSRDNPKLDAKTAYDVSLPVITSGLQPTDFYNAAIGLSFTSTKTPSHNTQPSGSTNFSILEGLPHNQVHNYTGGVGPLDPGPYGNMTNFLSTVDPIFFLHHANMDRLWDVWTRKQQALKLPYLPTGQDLQTLSSEPFLFFVDGNGNPVAGKGGDYLSTDVFDYDYAPGSGEDVIQPSTAAVAGVAAAIKGTVKTNVGSAVLPRARIDAHLADAAARPLVAEVTFPRPGGISTTREFDVLVNAPADVTRVAADSPYYAGTIAFFGPMMPGMKMSMDATFAVPLPKRPEAFRELGAAPGNANAATLNIRVVPSHGQGGPAPALKGLSIRG
jgi:tyrosinase